MKKEVVISIVIVLIVVCLNIITQKYTNVAVDEISSDLSKIREDLNKEENEKLEEEITRLEENWEEKKKKLVIYLEHAELEKAEMYIVEAKSHIETKEYNMAKEALDTCQFVLGHIKEKYEFSLKNIF